MQPPISTAVIDEVTVQKAQPATGSLKSYKEKIKEEEEEEEQRGEKEEPRMTIRKMTRNFRYLGLLLPDPAPDLDVESVRNLYAASYPEITTAALTGPEAVDGALVYTFSKAIGTKG